jgi:hypothetical protein
VFNAIKLKSAGLPVMIITSNVGRSYEPYHMVHFGNDFFKKTNKPV